LGSGGMILGRQSWPSYGKNQPTGFWIQNLRLEFLVGAEEDEPVVGFYICLKEDAEEEDYERAKKEFKDAVKKRLSSEQLKSWEFGDNEYTPLIGKRIASKQELLRMLSKGESERFVNTIVEQLEELAILIPDIDQIFDKKTESDR
jgi:hypothetical protein